MADEPELAMLLPCPFCGDDEELRVCQPAHMHGYWVVHCGCCAGEMQAESEGGAIAGWNSRPTPEIGELVERVANLLWAQLDLNGHTGDGVRRAAKVIVDELSAALSGERR